MISAIRGTILDITPGDIHIDTGSGFILRVLYPVSHYSQLKAEKEVLLYTVLKIKDEDVVLYGFLNRKEKASFEKLLSVSGVGGKTALSLLSAFSTNELVQAIDNSDLGKLSSIPGIGKKTAGRIILELTGKLELGEEQPAETVTLRDDLVSALVNLGYPAKNVREYVNKVLKENPEATSFELLFKAVLKKVAR
jgi:Holliday junction DNA helicase RuvA